MVTIRRIKLAMFVALIFSTISLYSQCPLTGPITGSTIVCSSANGSSLTYGVSYTTGSTYAWTITGGVQVGVNSSAVYVSWGSAGAGNVSVTETSSSGCVGTAVNLPVTITGKPIASSITGSGNVCPNSSITYSVTNTPGSTYTWGIGGGTQVSGGNTSSIIVNWGAGGPWPTGLSVQETNAGGCVGDQVSKMVLIGIPPTSTIIGNSNVCANSNGISYSVTNTVGSTYVWTITGGTQASGSNTNSITVNWGAGPGGIVQVIETNLGGCSSNAATKSVSMSPVSSSISGNSMACIGSSGIPYSVLNNTGSTYTWTIVGGNKASGGNTNSITVNWVGAGTGTVSVVETFSGGCNGSSVSKTVTIGSPTTSSVTGVSTTCASTNGVSYSVANNTGSIYAWTITNGTQASGTNTNSITVNWGVAGAGNVRVVETFSGGCVGSPVNLATTINALPTVSAPSSTMCGGTSMQLSSGSSGTWSLLNIAPQISISSGGLFTAISGGPPFPIQCLFTQSSTGCTNTIPITVINPPYTTQFGPWFTDVCANTNGVAYSVTNTAGNTYAWTITGGIQASGGTSNSITVNWGAAGVGNVSVIETNTSTGCAGAAFNNAVTVRALPATSAITGAAIVCGNATGVAYSVTNNVNSSYAWTITGGTLASGGNTNTITVNWGSTGPGNVSVVEKGSFQCVGAAVNKSVTINALPVISAVNGNATTCTGTNGVAYSVTNTAGSSYVWTVTGGTQASGTTTNSITVNWGAAGAGNVRVVETNSNGCAGTAINKAITINAFPSTSVITGSATSCASTNGVSYSVTNTAGSSYAWTITGGTQASGTTTNSITVNWGAPGAGNVRVVETNLSGCIGTSVNKAVTINPLPSTSAITGNATSCANTNGVSYSVASTAGSSYAWTITGGTQASGTTTNSITVNWGAAGAGNVRVVETNSNGCAGIAINKAITINAFPSTSVIIGSATSCANTNEVSYSVASTAGSSYAWTITGGTQASGTTTNSITVNWGAEGAGNVRVVETNLLGCIGTAANKAVTINALPSTSVITGSATSCASTNGVAYSVTNTAGSSYAWTITGGTQASGTTTNSITVNWGAAGAGNVRVVETNLLGCIGTAANKAVTINALPSTSAITGNVTSCTNTNGVAYSVTNTSGSSYTWTITGGTQASGTTTNSITVNWGAEGAGNVRVVETNLLGCFGTAVNKAVTINALPSTSAITGNATSCTNTNGVAYSVTNTSGSSYTWTITGGTQASGTATNSITVNWGVAGSGNVSVIETNSSGCVGTSVNKAITINAFPSTSAITGNVTSCTNTNGVAYSVTNTSGSSYTWTITGGTQASGTTTNNITINWGAAGAGNVRVVETNLLGCFGTAVNKAVTINALPSTSAITGNATSCTNTNGVAYSVTNTSGSSYTWTITGGTQASGTTTNSITVNWGAAGAGNVKVVETNSNGCVGIAVNKAVTINALPATSTIIGTATTCVNTNGAAYSVTNTAGSTYAWTIIGGIQATGGNTNSITINWGTVGAGKATVVETNSSGCTGTLVNMDITINTIPATSSITGNASTCSNTNGVPYSVINTMGSSYAWTITGGTKATGGATNSITINWAAAGTGNISLVETNSAGCIGSAVNYSVTINSMPTISTITGNATTCANLTGVSYSVTNTMGSTYAWTITGGTKASGGNSNSITVDWGASGSGNVKVVETRATGCVGTDVNKAVTIRSVAGSLTKSGDLCTTGTTLTAGSGTNYQWVLLPGGYLFGTSSFRIVDQPGTYVVTYTDAFGCNVSASVNVTGNCGLGGRIAADSVIARDSIKSVIAIDSVKIQSIDIGEFGIRPNPARNEVVISLSSIATSTCPIYFVDMSGRILLRSSIEKGASKGTVFIESLAAGTYVVLIAENKNYRYLKLVVYR